MLLSVLLIIQLFCCCSFVSPSNTVFYLVNFDLNSSYFTRCQFVKSAVRVRSKV